MRRRPSSPTAPASPEAGPPREAAVFVQSLFERASIGVGVAHDEHVVSSNPALQSLLGYSAEELAGMHFTEYTHPDDIPVGSAVGLARPNPENDYWCQEKRYVAKDGRVIWGRVVISGLPASMLGEGFALVMIEDITERRRAEDERQRSHDLLVKLSAQIPGEIFQYRLYPDGRACHPYASDAISDLFELTPELVREDASQIIDRLHPADRGRVSELILESARTLKQFHAEYRVLLPRQGLRWHRCDSSPERTEDGGTLWHGTTIDITERKQMEEALRQSEERYRQLLEAAHDWVWEVDENARYTFASPKVREILGYEPEEVLGKTPFDLMPPDEAERVTTLFGPLAAARGAFFDLENINLHKDGHPVSVETTGIPALDKDGNFLGYRGVDRDVTERKRAGEALLESEKRLARVAEDGGGRTLGGRHRPRLQQPSHHHHRL